MPATPQANLIAQALRGPGEAPRATEAPAHAPGIHLRLAPDGSRRLSPYDQALATRRGESLRLEPGRTYRLRIVSARSRDPGSSTIVPRPGDSLALLYEGTTTAVRIADAVYVLPDTAEPSLEHLFEVYIEDDAPSEEGRFTLLHWPDGAPEESRDVAYLPTRLEGLISAAENEILRSCSLDSTLPPECVALLHMEGDTERTLRVRGWSRGQPLALHQINRPPVQLGMMVGRMIEPQAIVGLMERYSRTCTQAIQQWLAALYSRHGSTLHLIICDHTCSETPWEMLGVELEQGQFAYVGAKLAIGRWIPVVDYTVSRLLNFEQEPPEGRALVYLDEHELTHTEAETAALTQVTHRACQTLVEVNEFLRKPAAGYGLIYLGCHGTFAFDGTLETIIKHEVSLGSLESPSNRLALLRLEGLPRFPEPRPLLFANACHSARMFEHETGRYGLVDILLARVATAYLGALGKIGMKYASEVAGRLLRAAAQPNGVQPAHFLRELREEEVHRLADRGGEDCWQRFIFAFMYVLYGNPFARLRLVPTEVAEGEA